MSNGRENTSYSAMLNIAELVPPPESVPILFDSTIHGIPSDSVQFHFDSIPGIPYRNRSLPSPTCIVLWSKVSPQYVDEILVRNSGNWLDPESVEVAGIEPNSGIERNSWESVRFHRDGISGIGWNWSRNVQHRRIGWLLTAEMLLFEKLHKLINNWNHLSRSENFCRVKTEFLLAFVSFPAQREISKKHNFYE
jgi:hypothetical protein